MSRLSLVYNLHGYSGTSDLRKIGIEVNPIAAMKTLPRPSDTERTSSRNFGGDVDAREGVFLTASKLDYPITARN